MNDNSRQLLHIVLQQRQQERAPHLSEQDYFEMFCAEQILKNFQLSYDELQAGIVDGEHDGGIDSAYAFVNGELVCEDFDTSAFQKQKAIQVELHLIQSKTSGSFKEAPVNCLISATRHLLNLETNYSELTQYNESVKAVLNRFLKEYRNLVPKFPALKIRYYYASRNAAATIHSNLERKRDELVHVAKGLFPGADVAMEFLGARHLYELAQTRPETTYQLKVKKNLSATDAHVVLTSLSAYVGFIKDSEGQIRQDLFEFNVRDFQGNTEVNQDIATTLQEEKVVDFWWMNNGVTILASKATLNGDVITMENPQIVNGLQTSKQIAEHSDPNLDNSHSIMVKIISSEDNETRDKIIKATNSQNKIQHASLRATERIQRDIEDALKNADLYYDRRKNYYKNKSKPYDRIIGIPLMAQAIMSIVLAEPHSARARPSTLVKADETYSEIFSDNFPLALYVNAALLFRRTRAALRIRSQMTPSDRTNLRFYVLYWLVASATRSVKPKPEHVANLKPDQVTDDEIEAAIDAVWAPFIDLGGNDSVAKGRELINSLKNKLQS